eukprot:scaffold1687_cov366-Pinguiococcus_pyrenoidosus.AAC.3
MRPSRQVESERTRVDSSTPQSGGPSLTSSRARVDLHGRHAASGHGRLVLADGRERGRTGSIPQRTRRAAGDGCGADEPNGERRHVRRCVVPARKLSLASAADRDGSCGALGGGYGQSMSYDQRNPKGLLLQLRPSLPLLRLVRVDCCDRVEGLDEARRQQRKS